MNYTEGEQCSEKVYPNDAWGAFHPHQCNKKAVVERYGKPYCKVHDPEYIKAKNEKSSIRYNAEITERQLGRLATSQCKAINPDNPMAVAQSIRDMYEALKLYQSHQQGKSGHYCWRCAEAINKAVAEAEGK